MAMASTETLGLPIALMVLAFKELFPGSILSYIFWLSFFTVLGRIGVFKPNTNQEVFICTAARGCLHGKFDVGRDKTTDAVFSFGKEEWELFFQTRL